MVQKLSRIYGMVLISEDASEYIPNTYCVKLSWYTLARQLLLNVLLVNSRARGIGILVGELRQSTWRLCLAWPSGESSYDFNGNAHGHPNL